MPNANRNLSQMLVVEELRTHEFFTGNVTDKGLIDAKISTDYGNRPLTPIQARFIAGALEELAARAEEMSGE